MKATFDSFLKVKGRSVQSGRKSVHLKGVNLGGWLMMEGYILHAPNVAVQVFERDFQRVHGKKGLEEFQASFRDHFIRADDLHRIAALGCNCIRVPFHYKLVEQASRGRQHPGIGYLDRVIRWARQSGLWVILDLHAAPGSQNHDWHSDSTGRAGLWTSRDCQRRTCRIWEFLADRYREETVVAGYDLMNEPVTEDRRALGNMMRELIRVIRRVDSRHMLFIEGNHWARDCDILEAFQDENTVFHIHMYDPMEFAFNFNSEWSYPNHAGMKKSDLRTMIQAYDRVARKKNIPVLVGEFGVNYRFNTRGECDWVADMTRWFNDCGFHWTYWTYKAVKNAVLPDGIFSYYENPDWVRRQGPLMGWDTYAACWKTQKHLMARSWQTKNFRENTALTRVLRKAF